MSPVVKYTAGRLGLFVACAAIVLFLPGSLNLFLRLLVALVISAIASFFLLRGWRDEMAEYLASSYRRRTAERERLRAALAGEDAPDGGAGRDSGDGRDPS